MDFLEKIRLSEEKHKRLVSKSNKEISEVINQTLVQVQKGKSTGDKFVDNLLLKYHDENKVRFEQRSDPRWHVEGTSLDTLSEKSFVFPLKDSHKFIRETNYVLDFRKKLEAHRGESIGLDKTVVGKRETWHAVFPPHEYVETFTSTAYFGIISRKGDSMYVEKGKYGSHIMINTGGRHVTRTNDFDAHVIDKIEVHRRDMPYFLGENYLIGARADDYFGRKMRRKLESVKL